MLRNLRAGARFLAATPSLRSLFLTYIPVGIVFGLQNSLLLPFALRALRASEFDYGLIEGLSTVGFVVGSLVMAQVGNRLHEGQWLAISFIGMAAASMVYALLSSVLLAIVVGAISSFMNVPSFIGRQLLIQRTTPRELRGRVSSAFFVVRDVVFVVGMAAAALADVIDVRSLFLAGGVLLLACGLMVLVLPGLRQPAIEWRRAIRMLRNVQVAPGLGLGRAATLADFDTLAVRLPLLASLSARDRRHLAAQTRMYEAPLGTAILRHGETSDAAYFILDGRAVAGREEQGAYRSLELLQPGDFFGEIAALTGMPRTANVVAEQPTTVLQVPATALRQMMSNPQVSQIFLSKMTERMIRTSMIELPRFASLDQHSLRELRQPDPQPVPDPQLTS